MVDRTARISRLLIFPGRYGGSNAPECSKKRHEGHHGKENPREEPTADLSREVRRDETDQGKEDVIREALASRSVGGEGSILDRGILAGQDLAHESGTQRR